MPPKRKTTIAHEDDSPPLKRRTRSNRPLVEAQPTDVPQSRMTRSRAGKGSIENVAADATNNEQPTTRRRGRSSSKSGPLEGPVKSLSNAPPSPPKAHQRTTTASSGRSSRSTASTKSSRSEPRRGRTTKRNDEAETTEAEPVASTSQAQLHQVPGVTASKSRGRATSKARGTARKVHSTRSRSRSQVPNDEPVDHHGHALEVVREEEREVESEVIQTVEDDRMGSPEPDELLISPPRKIPATPPRSVRPNTPPRSGAARSGTGTPRYVMHSVQITTPSWLKVQGTQNVGSPRLRIGAPSVIPLYSQPTLPIPSTPTKVQTHSLPRASPRRAQQFEIAHEENEFEDFPDYLPADVPASPTKRGSSRSPAKAKAKTSNSPTKTALFSGALPEHLETCLQAQMRVTLTALQKLPQITTPEDADVHANIIAYEQLSNLLLGTVQRGEGNSCLITGPRGSGKTRVSVFVQFPLNVHIQCLL